MGDGRMNGARGRKRGASRPDLITNPESRGDAVYGAIYGALRPLDELAAHMESKWGHGRLEALVSPQTAAKFAAVQERLNSAIDAGNAGGVAHEAAILWRGWKALDEEATRLGASPRPPGVWEIVADDGKPYRIVLTDDDKAGEFAHLEPKEAGARLLSVEELLRVFLSERFAVIRAAQEAFPGATVREVRDRQKRPSAPGQPAGPLFDDRSGEDLVDPEDEIPF